MNNLCTLCINSREASNLRVLFVSSYTKTFCKRIARFHVCGVLLYWSPWDQNPVTAVFSVSDDHVLSIPHNNWNLNNNFDTWVDAETSYIYMIVSVFVNIYTVSDPNQQRYCSESSVTVPHTYPLFWGGTELLRGTRWRSGWGTALQTVRSGDRFPMVSLEFYIDTILPAALWPWGQLSF
jgi:hypothetical protein